MKHTHPASAAERLKAQLAGLVVACPFNQANQPDCPLCQIRNEPLAKRIDWLQRLPVSEVEKLTNHHNACLAAKEASTDTIF